jgi:phosphoribosylaminoimidazole-succinocarboxamide synthase
MGQTISETHYKFPNQSGFNLGSVRDIYEINNQYLVMIATDRISAFDVLQPKPIPYKGQVLSQIAAFFLEATSDIVPNWMLSHPDPNVIIGHLCQPFRVEVVVRGYLTGHAWREYNEGKRELCGAKMPDGLKEFDPFPEPIITPATHAEVGHDEDISPEEIFKRDLIPKDIYPQIEKYALALYQRGDEMASRRNLILVDTKYEFGLLNGKIVLIDEIHTPDSSRYWYKNAYSKRTSDAAPKQLSKEFVREWLMEHGFNGQANVPPPTMSIEFIDQISMRYIELYEQLTGKTFEKPNIEEDIDKRIENNVSNSLIALDNTIINTRN